jgi:hypothetical protein
VALPGKAVDVAVGGGGRFLVLHVKDKRQLVVFDLSQGKVLKELPLAVVFPNAKLIARGKAASR